MAKPRNTPFNQRVVLHPSGYPTTIGELKKQGLWLKKEAREGQNDKGNFNNGV